MTGIYLCIDFKATSQRPVKRKCAFSNLEQSDSKYNPGGSLIPGEETGAW